MFHSAALKLTTYYLVIIMVLSIGTSFALYHVSSNELEQNAAHQIGYFKGLLGSQSAQEFAELRARQLQEDRDHLKTNLAAFNLLILIGGGAVSYGLARRTLKPIEEALESQKRFSADASHELRTPLAVIQAENEVALHNPKLTKLQAVEIIKSNLEEVAGLKALAEGLLALSQTDTEMEFESVSTTKFINSAVERVQKTAALKKTTITKPGPDAAVLVNGNSQSLADLMVILLDNAVKYSSKDSKIIVSSLRRGKTAEVSVADEGIGINKSDLPHIFDRFYRADDARSRDAAGGYGLGLAIAQKIAELHHGFIEVRSSPGAGSTFTLKLPARN